MMMMLMMIKGTKELGCKRNYRGPDGGAARGQGRQRAGNGPADGAAGWLASWRLGFIRVVS